MSGLMNCGICCMLLSIWGVIQLTLMGVFYKIEAVVLLEDVEAHEYDNYTDFRDKTKMNYSIVGRNCFIAAGLYLLMIAISFQCIRKARKAAIREAKLKEDDEVSCVPKVPREVKTKKKTLDG